MQSVRRVSRFGQEQKFGLAGRCEITFPFSLANRYFSVEPVSGIVSTTTFKIDYELDGNTIKISTQQYLPPVWGGLGCRCRC